jgi:hypothetical protein
MNKMPSIKTQVTKRSQQRSLGCRWQHAGDVGDMEVVS